MGYLGVEGFQCFVVRLLNRRIFEKRTCIANIGWVRQLGLAYGDHRLAHIFDRWAVNASLAQHLPNGALGGVQHGLLVQREIDFGDDVVAFLCGFEDARTVAERTVFFVEAHYFSGL